MVDIDALAAIVGDGARSWRERHAAIKQLGRSGDPRALTPLLAALRSEEKKLVARSVVALGNLGNPEAVPDLIDMLQTNADRIVRAVAAEALGKIGDPDSVEALQRATSDRVGDVRNMARSALTKMGRAAAAKVRANPEHADERLAALAAERRDRRAFNLPFILSGLVAAGAVYYWVGGSEAFGTALPIIIGAAVLAVGVNLLQGWWKNRDQ